MSPYTGVDCSIYDQGLNSGVLVSNQAVSGNAWNYYHITVPSGGGSLYWYVQQTSAQSDCDLYLKPGSYPTRTSYVAKENGVAPTFTLNVTNATQGIWYAGIFGYTDCGYSIRVTLGGSCPNACSGHGVCSAGVCACNAGFTGRDCSVQEITLVNGTWATGSVALQSWNYYLFQGTTTMDYLLIEMSHSTGMDADLFVLRNSDPSLFSWDYANLTTATVSTINITQVSNAVYHIGIYGYTAASYQLRATSHVPQTAADCPNQCSLHGTCVRGTCSCTTGFIGNECETMVRALTLGTTYSGYSGTNAWNYYHIQAFTANSLLIQTTQVLAPGANNTGDCDLYVRRNANPDRFNYDLMDISVSPTFNLTIPNPANDVWYIGLYGWRACQYNLRVSEISTCSCALGGHGSCNSGSNACVCQPGWAGPGCNIAIVTLQNGVAASGTVAMNNWAFFQITTTSTLFEVAIKETNSTGLLWLFVNQTPNFPTLTAYDDADQTPGISIHYSFMEYSTTQTYTYTIGVYGNLFIGSLTQTYPFQIVAWSPNP